MGFDDCYLLGQLVKTHGLKGDLIAHLDVDYPEDYKELESVFVDQNGKLVPFFLNKVTIQGAKAYVAFEDVNGIDEASKLVGLSVYLPLENLPPMPKGKYYFHQLVGMNLIDGNSSIGIVEQLYDLPNNRLLGVNHNGTEVLVPLEDGIIDQVDVVKKEIHVNLPDGLLDVFLEN